MMINIQNIDAQQSSSQTKYQSTFKLPVIRDDKNEQDSITDQWSQNSKKKLTKVLQFLKKQKDKRRAHYLAMNLPSRMLKSFDQNKFDLLNDRAFYYNKQTYPELINQKLVSSSFPKNHQQKSSDANFGEQSNSIEQSGSTSLQKKYDKQDSILLSIKTKPQSKRQQIYAKYLTLKNDLNAQKLNIKKVIDQIPVISPSNHFKFIWDIIYMIVILICLFYLPITIAFDFCFSDMFNQHELVLIPSLIFFNMFLKINTGYFKKGQVINSRYQIIKKYFKQKLIKDILCIYPLTITLLLDANDYYQQRQIDIHQSSQYYPLLLLPFIFKAFSINSTLKKFEERFNLPRYLLNIIQLVKLLFTILFINHLFACIWLFTARIQREKGANKIWLNYNNLISADWQTQFTAGFYFVTVTMITVGYGDILPQNNLEYFLCVVTMMLACGVFGYSLNEVGSIFNNFFQVDREIKRKQILIQRFMSTKNINTKLQYQIREYLDYYWREQAETDHEEKQQIIDQLSDSLRKKLLFEANKIVLRDNPIFKQNFSKTVIEQTVPLILEMKYSPESIISQKDVQDDCSIYFIEKGSVEIVLNSKGNNKTRLLKLSKGESFGAYSFFTGLPRIYNIRSNEFTTVLKIRRQDFLQLLQMHTEDYETFCFIRDQISYLNDYSKIGQACKSCNSSYHMVSDCQYLHYVPNKARVINRYNNDDNNQQTQRTIYQRRNQDQKYHFKNSLAIHQEVIKQSIVFLEQNESVLNLSDDMTQYSEGYFNNDAQENDQAFQYRNEGIEQKREFNQKSENEIEYEGSTQIIKKNTLSRFGQDHNHTKTRSFNSVDKQIDSPQETNNDQISLNIPDLVQQAYIYQTTSPILEHDMLSKKNVLTPSSRKNLDKNVNFYNRSKTQITDKQEQASLSNYTFSQQMNLNQGFESANRQILNQRKKSNTEENQEFFQKKPRSILCAKSHKDFSLTNIEELEQTPSSEYKRKVGSSNSDQIRRKMLSQYKVSLSSAGENQQIDQIIKQLQFLIIQNQQNVNNEEKISNQIQSEIDIFENFDKMRQFVKYNPSYNYSSVISRFNRLQDQKKRTIRKNCRSKRRQTHLLSKTFLRNYENNMTQNESKNGIKNNLQNTNNAYENTESKRNSKKGNKGSLKKYDLDSEALGQNDSQSQGFILSPLSGDQLSFKLDISGQPTNFMNLINQVSQEISIKKDVSNRFTFYQNLKNEQELENLNNCEILSEESNTNKNPNYISFNQSQIKLSERNRRVDKQL